VQICALLKARTRAHTADAPQPPPASCASAHWEVLTHTCAGTRARSTATPRHSVRYAPAKCGGGEQNTLTRASLALTSPSQGKTDGKTTEEVRELPSAGARAKPAPPHTPARAVHSQENAPPKRSTWASALDACARRNQRVAQLRASVGAQTTPHPHADTHYHMQENTSTRCPCLLVGTVWESVALPDVLRNGQEGLSSVQLVQLNCPPHYHAPAAGSADPVASEKKCDLPANGSGMRVPVRSKRPARSSEERLYIVAVWEGEKALASQRKT